MYLAIDVGGSKTLVASFTDSGELKKQFRFPTPRDYKEFIKQLEKVISRQFAGQDFLAACAAVPAVIDRRDGIAKEFGNLGWRNVPVKSSLEKLLPKAAVYIENDASLGGLSEALSHKKYKRVLYLTVSTGIGDGIIINGKIDPAFADSEAGHMLINHNGRLAKWEDFASGRALANRFGRLAKDLQSPKAWKEFAGDLALGIFELLAVVRPEIIIIGGSVGQHFAKFGDYLRKELDSHPAKMYKTPPVVGAKRPAEAVIYGCYEFIRQNMH